MEIMGFFKTSRRNLRPATLTLCAASCTMNWVRALSSAVRAFGLHPKGRPFKSDSAHHCDASPFSGDVVQLVRTLPFRSLESHTVTAEPQNQLPHRTSNHLEYQRCLSIDFKGAGVLRHQSRPVHGAALISKRLKYGVIKRFWTQV